MTESPIYSVRTEEEVAREILAGTDIASLPRDYPLDKLAEEVMDELYKARAEIERLRAALRAIRDEIIYGGGDMIQEPDIDRLHDIARAALSPPNHNERKHR